MTAVAEWSQDYTCPDCGGASRAFKGTTHRWRCDSCVSAVIGINAEPSKAERRAARYSQPRTGTTTT